MSTLIAYAGKHGATAELAQIMREAMAGEAETADLLRGKKIDPVGFDTVIVGGAVFAGSVHKAVRRFCEEHEETLRSRRLALFLCSLREEDAEDTFARSFPAALREYAAEERWLGGRIIFSQHNPLMRGMLKKLIGSSEDIDTLRREEAGKLAAAVNGATRVAQ
jgi:menaquinone-dependent protoporphyrinogen oxidase